MDNILEELEKNAKPYFGHDGLLHYSISEIRRILNALPENELEWWEKCECQGLNPFCTCLVEALRQHNRSTNFKITRRVIERYNRTAHVTKDGEPLIGTVSHLSFWIGRQLNG